MIFTLLAYALLLLTGWALALAPAWLPYLLAAYGGFFVIYFWCMLSPSSSAFGPVISQLPGVGKQVVYLTFDDGPHAVVTPAVLRLLRQKQVPATFFVVGEKARALPEVVAQIHREGHVLANHTDSHHHLLTLTPLSVIQREIERCSGTIAELTGKQPDCFRPCAGIKDRYIAAAARRAGLLLVNWNKRSLDTVCRSPRAMIRRMCAKPANGDILLFHDRPTRCSLADKLAVLTAVIDCYREQGFVFRGIKKRPAQDGPAG